MFCFSYQFFTKSLTLGLLVKKKKSFNSLSCSDASFKVERFLTCCSVHELRLWINQYTLNANMTTWGKKKKAGVKCSTGQKLQSYLFGWLREMDDWRLVVHYLLLSSLRFCFVYVIFVLLHSIICKICFKTKRYGLFGTIIHKKIENRIGMEKMEEIYFNCFYFY